MITFSLNTFVKICLLDTGGRIAEIKKILANTGGYDYYKPLQRAVRFHCRGDIASALDSLASPTNEQERKNNHEAYDMFCAKFGNLRSLEPIEDRKKLAFKDAGMAISIDPIFGYSKAENQLALSIWPTQKPPMTQRYGAVACLLMRKAYASSQRGNYSFQYADLTGGRTYSENQINENTPLILNADLHSIGRLIKEL